MESPTDFKDAGCQLHYHSDTFPKVMGLMLALTPLKESKMMPFYAKHAYGESDHSEMLLEWMIKHGLVSNHEEVRNTIITKETNACVNYAYQMAIEQDREKWLVGLNSGIERCSNDFFKAISPKMHDIGAGDEYFDVHVEADEHHSIMGLDYIEEYNADSERGKILIAKALEGIELWASMIHSWIGIYTYPKFDLKGNLIKEN
jgi:pyrroloquinoline quinone (PQQ) biosynthesis protein C